MDLSEQCQCYTNGGKGPQCTRKHLIGSQYCGQHTKKCDRSVTRVKQSVIQTPPTRKPRRARSPVITSPPQTSQEIENKQLLQQLESLDQYGEVKQSTKSPPHVRVSGKNDCSRVNRPQNGYCPTNKPYMSMTPNGYQCCYAKPRFKSIKKVQHEIGEKHEQQLVNLLKKGVLKRTADKWSTATSLEKFKNFKIVVYDLESTGLPYAGTYPDVTQIAMYSPRDNEFFVKYVNPTKPITAFASELTGIYKTFKDIGGYYSQNEWVYRNPFMRSGAYTSTKEKLYPGSLAKMFADVSRMEIAEEVIVDMMMEYGLVNLGLMDQNMLDHIVTLDTFKQFAESHAELDYNDSINQYLNIIESYYYYMLAFFKALPPPLQKKVTDIVRELKRKDYIKQYQQDQHPKIVEEAIKEYGLKSVENELPFGQIIDQVDQFIRKGTNSDTIIFMVAHNGQVFDEPVLRDEYKKAKKIFYLTDNILFVDSYLMALQWIDKSTTENFKLGTLYKKFINEEMPGWHDAKADVAGLWKMITGLFKEVWGRNDLPYIALGFLKFFYSSQMINEPYLRAVADEIFRSKEFEDLEIESEKVVDFLKPRAHQAPV